MSTKSKRCKFGFSAGSNNYIIYAVILKDHPEIVKLGRTNNWYRRSYEYVYWNLANGDGIQDLAVYCITEEYVNLPMLETACLSAMPRRPYRGKEWFKASLDEAKKAIECTLNASQLSYTDWLDSITPI